MRQEGPSPGASLGARQIQCRAGPDIHPLPAPPQLPWDNCRRMGRRLRTGSEVATASGAPLGPRQVNCGSPSKDWPSGCLSTQLGCGHRKRWQGSLRAAPLQWPTRADTPPLRLQAKSRRGESETATPFNVPTQLGTVRGHPGPLSALEFLPAHRTTGAPWDSLAHSGSTPSTTPRYPGPEPSAQCHSSNPCCSETLGPRLLLPRAWEGEALGQ